MRLDPMRALVVISMIAVGCTPAREPQQSSSQPTASAAAPDSGSATRPKELTDLVLHPVALELIDRLDENGHTMATTGDEVTSPESFGSLVEMGVEGLPTVLLVATTTGDPWIRAMLISIAGRIGDPSARPMLVRFLRGEDPSAAREAIDALGRLGGAGSVPLLRELLRDEGAAERLSQLQILEAIYRCGDDSVLGDVLAIGLSGERDEPFSAAQILSRHQPLRDALGLEGPYRENSLEVWDEATFLPAADEWYREAVLGEPSPWRTAELADFAEPLQAEKRAAWSFLLKSCEEGNSRWSILRLQAVDPVVGEVDARRAMTVILGYGHAHGLSVIAWRPESGDTVRGHRFDLLPGEPRSEFPEDYGTVAYSTANLTSDDFRAVVVGMRTILGARIVPWWSGPNMGAMMSSSNFAISIRGLGAEGEPPAAFCGYLGSSRRVRYLTPRAAGSWMDQVVADRTTFERGELKEDARRIFSEVFRFEQPRWDGARGGWWWVRERMIMLAGMCGDAALQAPLERYLAPEYVHGKHSLSRTAAKACSALAAISGEDLRFTANGAPRPLVEVARAYLELPERK